MRGLVVEGDGGWWGVLVAVEVLVVWLVCCLNRGFWGWGGIGCWSLGGLAVMGLVVVWLVGPRSAPGIPRSHRCARSRPFRAAKGAVRVVVMGWNGGLVGVLSEL